MKKLTTIPVALFICIGAYAQGTIQYANNPGVPVKTTINGVTANANSTGGDQVEMFYQIDNGGAAPAAITSMNGALGNWIATSVTPVLQPPAGPTGVFDAPSVTLQNVPLGATVWLEIVGWDNNAASVAAALSGGSTLFGNSAVWSEGTGGAGTPPATAPAITGAGQFTGMTLTAIPNTPEPTTIALGALGAASLLAFRRKK
ncbi:MAG TPA: PEP-CTERM sorting domain-containing protein [Verrucomicrobiae bacterium]|jgi:hypothetical protein|nr:PEP-CTERM sorting domain-containing protein [Verrucomicrobiae bacterium]